MKKKIAILFHSKFIYWYKYYSKNANLILKNFKHIIVGAGLTGLSVAYQLTKLGIEDFILLEGRNRIGGRILTENNIDFGAVWFQEHHFHIQEILQELGLSGFEQYILGKGIIASKSGVPIEYFEQDSSYPPVYRINGSSVSLIERMAESFSHKIKVQTKITKVENTEEGIVLHAENEIYRCQQAVICIPPKLVHQIGFEPNLPNQLNELLKQTHTWMSQAIKIGLTFSSPFWREKGFSGVVFGQSSPITEMYDHSSLDGKVFGLMGFVNEEFRFESQEKRKRRILNFLENLFGKEINNYITYSEKDWAKEEFTTIGTSDSLPYKTFYGSTLFNKPYYNGKLFFAAAEMALINGGYMDGAIASGFETVNRMMKNNTLEV